MGTLKDMEEKSIYILREVYKKFNNPCLLWSMGKDSTVLLWLCKKAFYDKIPFKVVHIDTGLKFKEMISFRDEYAKKWNLDILSVKYEGNIVPENGRFECCNARKTKALKQVIDENKFDSVIVGIRRDENSIRGKERYFSPRDNDFRWNVTKDNNYSNEVDISSCQDAELSGWDIYATEFSEGTNHVRIHPLLHWDEIDIWKYIKQENIPVCNMYFSNEGKRFRSLGCSPCTTPFDSKAGDVDSIISELLVSKNNERDGRNQDKENEYNMQKLRSLGYM